ncbi:polyubiquitin-tagged protein recognition complex, Npl4 component [Meredithblackwellia eburnea MCA 4105]
MLIRIRSRDGNFRFDLQPHDDVSVLVQKILETSTDIDPSTLALSQQPRGGENLVSGIKGNLASLGLNHGDLLFASYSPLAPTASSSSVPQPAPSTSATLSGKPVPSSSSSSAPSPTPNGNSSSNTTSAPEVVEDVVDKYWAKRDGKIPRKKGQDLCKCGPKSMCDYCMPLEPYDATYQQSHAIKHLSFHSYLRKINSSAPLSSQSTSFVAPLSDPTYRVQVPCTSGSHPSWPAGICTKCQPSAVTLTRQTYRLVDHVEFAKPDLVEGLLNFWRQTGTQRFGYLLGKYEPYEEVPMGIKAVVEAIHEPPQEPLADGVSVGFPWDEQAVVEQLAADTGLKVVGMIFTDLVQDVSEDAQGKKKNPGKVVSKRHANSFFLSSLEVIFAATLQTRFQNKSKWGYGGHFSSKFVTCVLSADTEGNIGVEAYQVSDQAMAMVEADMVEASVDPGVMRVKEEGPERYIPDVFFRYKNKYGIEVKESAKPCFPVEYLIVNVTNGFPKTSSPLFTSTVPFPIENRPGLADQSFTLVASKFAQATKDVLPEVLDGSLIANANQRSKVEPQARKVVEWLCDWHLLRFLQADCVGGVFEADDIRQMAKVARTKSVDDLASLCNRASWQTFLAIAAEQVSSSAGPTIGGGSASGALPDRFDDGFEIPPDVDVPPDHSGDVSMDDVHAAGGGAGGSGGGMVVCPHCTFENNPGTSDCEICGLPLAG